MIYRTLAAFIGSFVLLNLIGGLFTAGRFDANHWWFDFRPVPRPVSAAVLLISAAALLAWTFRPGMAQLRFRITLTCIGLLLIVAILNSIAFYVLLARGQIRTPVPLPLSLILAILLVCLIFAIRKAEFSEISRRDIPFILAALGASVVLVPFSQIVFFGNTDYRRPADIAVVFGARTYADGQPSNALSDRVRTAVQLYHDGLVSQLYFSGGPGDGSIHETEAMRTLAIELGVPAGAIVLDQDGLNTTATVTDLKRFLHADPSCRILAVSHFYHLPRIKLEFERAGFDSVYTVPAPQQQVLQRLPYLMAREVAALWSYYLRAASYGAAA